MIVTTTPNLEGKTIIKYHGIVSGEAIMGANFVKDIFAQVRDFVGGRSATYEREMQNAREIALTELQERAQQMGANAVVGVVFDYEAIGQGGSMIMVAISGTAVTIS